MNTNPENRKSDDGVGHRFDPTRQPQPPGPGPKPKTFEDGVLEAVKILDFFRMNSHAHWVRVRQDQPGVLITTCPELCKFKGKRNCQTRAGRCDGMSTPVNSKQEAGIVEFILCSFPYPAKNPLAMILPGWEVQQDRPGLTDKL